MPLILDTPLDGMMPLLLTFKHTSGSERRLTCPTYYSFRLNAATGLDVPTYIDETVTSMPF